MRHAVMLHPDHLEFTVLKSRESEPDTLNQNIHTYRAVEVENKKQ